MIILNKSYILHLLEYLRNLGIVRQFSRNVRARLLLTIGEVKRLKEVKIFEDLGFSGRSSSSGYKGDEVITITGVYGRRGVGKTHFTWYCTLGILYDLYRFLVKQFKQSFDTVVDDFIKLDILKEQLHLIDTIVIEDKIELIEDAFKKLIYSIREYTCFDPIEEFKEKASKILKSKTEGELSTFAYPILILDDAGVKFGGTWWYAKPKEEKIAIGKILEILDYARDVTCNLVLTTPIVKGKGLASRLLRSIDTHVIIEKSARKVYIPHIGYTNRYALYVRSEIVYNIFLKVLKTVDLPIQKQRAEPIPEVDFIFSDLDKEMKKVRAKYVLETFKEIEELLHSEDEESESEIENQEEQS